MYCRKFTTSGASGPQKVGMVQALRVAWPHSPTRIFLAFSRRASATTFLTMRSIIRSL